MEKSFGHCWFFKDGMKNIFNKYDVIQYMKKVGVS